MIASTVLVATLFCGALASPLGERIIGGTQAVEGQFPYMVSLRRGGSHSCGGSILDSTHILTASHCVHKTSTRLFSIQYGSLDRKSDENIIDVDSIKMHEGYLPGGNYPNDIAILTLADEIPIDGVNVRAITLPDGPAVSSTEESVTAVLSGWGYTEVPIPARKLLFTELPLFNDDTCKKYLPTYDPKLHVCAGALDGTHKQCSGDSGGPLNIGNVQYGVVSWSYKPCTISDRPGLFSNVFQYKDWILKNMEPIL